MTAFEVRVPDIGEFESVDVIEVLIAAGDTVAVETSLITLESDKATMEIPSPVAGVVTELLIEVGAQVSEGDVIARVEVDASTAVEEAEPKEAALPAAAPVQAPSAEAPKVASVELPDADVRTEVLVLGAGPGGYTAAFRAADLGKQVVLVERYASLGGVCLNVGCIPSKALLHVAEGITGAEELVEQGVSFGEPKIDLDALRRFKDRVVKKLTTGLAGLAKRRDVQVVEGAGQFEGPHLLRVDGANGVSRIAFEYCIVAAGSRAVELPGFPHDDSRVMDSTDALALDEVPARLLVVGGGIIGLEMASVYHALGAKVSVVELMDQLMVGADPDVVKPLRKLVEKRYENIWLDTRVTGVSAESDGLHVGFAGDAAPESEIFDGVLVAVGRRPNGDQISAEAAGLQVDEGGFIPVDAQLRTNLPHVFAIGDVNGQPMLAHKASHEGKTAAEVIAGQKVSFDPKAIPSVAYTDPEVAWVGLTETAAKAEGIPFERAVFPWQASGRALGIGRPEGMTKLIIDPESRRILGAGLCGPGAGELIAELVLAIELGADVEDLALTIHPHPTLSETVGFASEIAEGTITDLYLPKRR